MGVGGGGGFILMQGEEYRISMEILSGSHLIQKYNAYSLSWYYSFEDSHAINGYINDVRLAQLTSSLHWYFTIYKYRLWMFPYWHRSKDEADKIISLAVNIWNCWSSTIITWPYDQYTITYSLLHFDTTGK